MRGSFGGCDVTSKLQSLESSFEVNVRLFGDPKSGVYKFLKLTDLESHESVLVGENDIVWSLKTAIKDPPPCRVLAPLEKYTRGKQGIVLNNITSCKIPSVIKTLAANVTQIDSWDLLEDIKMESCDFVFCSDLLLCVANPIALLCAIYALLKEGGYCIVAIPIATQVSKTEKETNRRFDELLCIFDSKTDNNAKLDTLRAANNMTMDFNVLRAMLRFALLIPQYAQRHEERQVIIARKVTLTPSPQSANSNTKFFDKSQFPSDVMFCPHCNELFCKDNKCSFVYCGFGGDGIFHVGYGCGKSFCYTCGKKYCGQHYDSQTGKRLSSYRDVHNADCCRQEQGFQMSEYCCGGHSSHCDKRW